MACVSLLFECSESHPATEPFEEGGGVEPLPVKIPQGSNLIASHLAAPSRVKTAHQGQFSYVPPVGVEPTVSSDHGVTAPLPIHIGVVGMRDFFKTPAHTASLWESAAQAGIEPATS